MMAHLHAFLLLSQSSGDVTPRGGDVPPRTALDSRVPRMANAEDQLVYARRLKREMNAHGEGELAARRRLAVEAYRAVRLFHSEARLLGVEAAFRAGELLRSAGDEAGALCEFRWAQREGVESEFRAPGSRSDTCTGAGRYRGSQAYLDVAGTPPRAGATRGRLVLGRHGVARARPWRTRVAWRRVAGHGTDPLARITAFDELGLSYLMGRLEGAAGVLDQCLRALSASALEETEQGERVENALLRMRVVEELSRALAREREAGVERGSPRKS
jgi:hypothetical protein